MAGVVADRPHQGELAAALQHVAQQNRAEPERAEDETESAQGLKGREIRVLDTMKRREAFRGRDDVESEIDQPILERRAHLGRTLGRRVDEEEAVPVVVGKHALEVTLADQQLALEDAVRERPDDAQRDRPVGVAVQDEVVADRQVERIGQRRGVGQGGNRAVLELAVEQQPRVRFFLRRLGGGGAEPEPALGHERRGRGQDARILRLVQIQATGILARPQAEARQGHPGQRLALGEQIPDEQLVLSLRARWVLHHRQQRVGQQGIAAGAGGAIQHVSRTLAPECVDRHDDERRERDQRDAEHAASRPVRRVAESHRGHRPGPVCMAARPLIQPRPRQHEQRGQQCQPTAEEPAGGADQSGRSHPDQGDPAADQQNADPPRPCPGGHRRRGDFRDTGHLGHRAGQQTARRGRGQRTQRPADRPERGQDAARRPGGQHCRRHVEGQPRRPDRIYPPGPQAQHDELRVEHRAEDAERAPEHREDAPLGQKHAADGSRGKPGGAQQTDLAQALLDAQAEEEARQQQRRHHQEEAEIDEVQPEVGHPSRRLQRQGAGRVDDEPERQRVERFAERGGEPVPGRGQALARRREESNRRHPAPTRRPQPLPGRERNERLRRRAVIVPVGLVRRPDQLQVDRERRIPVDDVGRLGDARVVGCEVGIVGGAGNRDDTGHPHLGFVGRQPPLVGPQVVLDRQRIARHGAEIVGRPLVQDDRRGPTGVGGHVHVADRRQVAGGDHRVRRDPVPAADLVGQVGEHRLGPQAETRRHLLDRRNRLVGQQPRRRLHGDGVMVRNRPHPQAETLQGRLAADRRLRRRLPRRFLSCSDPTVAAAAPGIVAEQQRIDAPFLLQLALQPRQRHEHRAGQPLLRPERELAELAGLEHAADAEPQRAADVVAPAVQRAERHRRRLLDAHQQGIVRGGIQLTRQPAAHQHGVASHGERLGVESVERPEALVDSVDLHPRRTPAAGLVRHETLYRHQRRGGGELSVQCVGRQHAGGKRLGHEAGARHHAVDGPQALERQRA